MISNSVYIRRLSEKNKSTYKNSSQWQNAQPCYHQFGEVDIITVLTSSSFLMGDRRFLDHSSNVLRWRAFKWIQGLFSLIIFSACFQSSAMPNATRRAHITVTLRPWPAWKFPFRLPRNNKSAIKEKQQCGLCLLTRVSSSYRSATVHECYHLSVEAPK